MSTGRERSREAWQKILDKRKATTAARREDKENDALAEILPAPKPVVKSVATCGQERCCGRGGPEITYDVPSAMGVGGLAMSPFSFGGKITPPMACGGALWIPRKKSEYEKRREARKNAPASGLEEFRKK